MSAALEVAPVFDSGWGSGFKREPRLTVSRWADEHRILTSIDSAEPGRWRTARTPYLADIMDALSPHHPAKRVIFMAGAQVGKTQTGNNWLGYVIHHAPAPTLLVLPTVEVAKRISKQRLAPMIAAMPCLRDRVADVRERDSGNTVLMKTFDGGILIITGANSSAGLRSMPIRNLFCDEADAYPGDVDGEGDPVALAEERTATFWNAKVYLDSTPTIAGLSRIEAEFNASHRLRYFIPCPSCGHMDFLQWRVGGWNGEEGRHHHIHFDGRDPDTSPASARMRCASCDALIEERWKPWMMDRARAEWRQVDGTPRDHNAPVVGFHLSSLYSPLGWKSWGKCVAQFLRTKGDPFRLKTWVNTTLGETWQDATDAISVHMLRSRCERYVADVPAGVGVLVASVDVQGDRLEAQVKGYGDGEESWLIAYDQIFKKPTDPEAWRDLDRFLAIDFEHASKRTMRVECTVVDSNYETESVYKYVRSRRAARRNVWAIKGGNQTGLPLVNPRPSLNNAYRVPLFVLCTDEGKSTVLSRLLVKPTMGGRDGIPPRGPAFVHMPDWVDDEYLEQMTAEKAVKKYEKGRGLVRVWEKVRERNEAFDLEVYALAALYILGHSRGSLSKFLASLGRLADKWETPAEVPLPPEPEEEPTAAAPGPVLPKRKRERWVDAWRK